MENLLFQLGGIVILGVLVYLVVRKRGGFT